MIATKPYQQCLRCVMDTSAQEIYFDDYGICNYCTEFLRQSEYIWKKDSAIELNYLENFVAKVKTEGKGKPYDCIIGLSGGVDSSWALVQAVRLGLRPLAVHMDNGWNSELAQNNIANLVRALKVDLYTHVIDWSEYKNLMQAFFNADVIDVELLYDNAMLAVNYQLASKNKIKYILAGTNQSTEGMRMPRGWNWFKFDKKNIKVLAKKFANIQLKTFPSIGTVDYVWYTFIKGHRWISFLDFFNYNKKAALSELENTYSFKPYPYKHYESIFTRFYQGYILPKKFNVDKRRVHLSTLIISSQLTRIEALKELESIPYTSQKTLEDDQQYFLKKMGWTIETLEAYIARPEKSHLSYLSEKPLWDGLMDLYKKINYW